MRKLFLTLLLFISVVACDDAYKSSIPDVAFELSYNVAVFPSITQPGYFVKVEKNTHGIPVGYAGIILGKSVSRNLEIIIILLLMLLVLLKPVVAFPLMYRKMVLEMLSVRHVERNML